MSDLQPPDEPGDEAVSEEDAARRYPSTIGGAFYLIVLAITAIGIDVRPRFRVSDMSSGS